MNRGVRHRVQRERRVALKADAAILLDRIATRLQDHMTPHMMIEIEEMRRRLQPPKGLKAPIVFTDYSKRKPG